MNKSKTKLILAISVIVIFAILASTNILITMHKKDNTKDFFKDDLYSVMSFLNWCAEEDMRGNTIIEPEDYQTILRLVNGEFERMEQAKTVKQVKPDKEYVKTLDSCEEQLTNLQFNEDYNTISENNIKALLTLVENEKTRELGGLEFYAELN